MNLSKMAKHNIQAEGITKRRVKYMTYIYKPTNFATVI